MNQLQIFKNSQFGEVRVATTESNEPLFCLADVCSILAIANTSRVANELLDDDLRTTYPIVDALGRTQNAIFINESGLYQVIFQSRKPEAKVFRQWVTGEVLPTIRKHGAYMSASMIEKALTDPDTIIQLAINLKEERRQKEILQQKAELQSREIARNAPKVEYFEGVLQSESTYTTTQVAKELGMGAPTLNRKLKELRVQYLRSGTWVLYEKYQNRGYTKTKTHTYLDNGVQKTSMLTVWTEKGRHFIHTNFQFK